MGPRASQNLRSPSPIMAPGHRQERDTPGNNKAEREYYQYQNA